MDFQKVIDRLYLYSVDHFIHWRRHIKEYFWAIVIALILRALVITIYRIPTGSMIPTFREGDTLIANRFYYGLKIPFTDGLPGWKLPGIRDPRVGDVVIFRSAGEEDFYRVLLQPQTEAAKALVFEMNSKTLFPHPCYVDKGFTNYIFLSDPFRASALIGSLYPAYDLILYKDLYEKYQSQISDPAIFKKHGEVKLKASITFAEQKYPGLLRSLLNTPVAGVSMIFTSILNTPLGFTAKALVALPFSLSSKSFSFDRYIRKVSTLSLYPNPFVDMTKEYVKRMIADEGDRVEIINKQVFVNGKPHVPDLNSFVEEVPGRGLGDTGAFQITTNSIEVEDKYGKRTVRYPLRVIDGKPPVYPSRPFEPGLWPYFPNFNNEYTDNFGPIIVPKGHIFAMGDNRDNSFDSRYWGCVPKWSIIGTPMIKIFPIGRAGLIQ